MATAPRVNICDLNEIYSKIAYTLPRETLESYLDGKAFDNKTSYSPEKRAALERDIINIFDRQSYRAKLLHAVISNGAPGCGKTVLMCADLQKTKDSGELGFSYTDPDDVCLKGMTETYQAELQEALSSLNAQEFESQAARMAAEKSVRVELYNRWRPGSNAANHIILAHLIMNQFAFYFGTTATGPQTHLFLKLLKDTGYHLRHLHLTASDEVRWGSVQERDKTFVQTTEVDIREKGKLFPQRIADTYMKYADVIEFYHRAKVDQTAVLGATWVRNGQTENGKLTIHNPEAYAQIKTVHDVACEALGRKDILWKDAVEKHSEFVPPPPPAPEAGYCACLENFLPSWLLGVFESVAVCIASLVQGVRGWFVTSNA